MALKRLQSAKQLKKKKFFFTKFNDEKSQASLNDFT